MKRLIAVILSFGLVGLALYADGLENTSPGIGAFLWGVFFLGGVALLYWQSTERKISPLICLIALIPYFNLLLIPIASIVLSLLPTRKTHSKKKS